VQGRKRYKESIPVLIVSILSNTLLIPLLSIPVSMPQEFLPSLLRMDVKDCIDAYISLSEEIFDKQSLPISLLTGKVKARFDSEKLKSAVQKIIKDRCNLPVNAPLYEEENPITRV
jgi:hypothetical protein